MSNWSCRLDRVKSDKAEAAVLPNLKEKISLSEKKKKKLGEKKSHNRLPLCRPTRCHGELFSAQQSSKFVFPSIVLLPAVFASASSSLLYCVFKCDNAGT